MEPVGALLHGTGTVMAKLGKVRRQNRRRDDCTGGHVVERSGFKILAEVDVGEGEFASWWGDVSGSGVLWL